jgi:hypothetical protein
MKSYTICPKPVLDRAAALLKKYFPDHHKLGVTVQLLFVSHDGDGPALTFGGYPAAGVIRKTSAKERAAGRADAEMVLDEERFAGMTERQRDALLHHELYHLVLDLAKKTKQPKIDAAGRPVLKIRKHDHQFGWFDETAKIYGEDSGEVQQARHLMSQSGQLYFSFSDKPGKAA